jgi:hypothetical protein
MDLFGTSDRFHFLYLVNEPILAFQESANVAFRMSDDNPQALLALAYPANPQGLSPSGVTTATPLLSISPPGVMSSASASPSSISPISPVRAGPMSLLTTALSKSPSLHTFATHVPNVWNETILCVSQNPSLQKIILGDSRTGVMVTGLFMSEAKKHSKLVELIKAGTYVFFIFALRVQLIDDIFSHVAQWSERVLRHWEILVETLRQLLRMYTLVAAVQVPLRLNLIIVLLLRRGQIA